jgi:hypothetical protein
MRPGQLGLVQPCASASSRRMRVCGSGGSRSRKGSRGGKVFFPTTASMIIVTPSRWSRTCFDPAQLHRNWVGGLFYLWVLNRDLWVENFG